MSSVGSSDSSNRSSDEIHRRRLEEQRKAEAEAIRKHKTELRRLTESHYQQLEDLKSAHAKQMAQLKKESSDQISSRDYRHQKEIDGLRTMHRKQQQAMADENMRREGALRKANSGDSNRKMAAAEARIAELESDYKSELQRKENSLTQTLSDAREAQQEAIDKAHQRLSKSHDAELTSVLEERNGKIADLQRQMSDYRESSEIARRDRELQHLRDMNRASDNLMRTVANERASRNDSEEILRDGFKQGIENMRDRFENAQKSERQAKNMAMSNFTTGAMDRIDSQVRRLENEKEELKAGNARRELKLKAQKDLEIDHIKEAWQKNVDNYKDQRDLALQGSNERNRRDIAEVRDNYDKQMADTNRYYRGRMGENNRIQRQAYDNLVGDFESRTENLKTVTDQRVKTIAENAAEEKARLSELQKHTHIATQRSHQDQMRELREVMEDDKQQTVNRLQDQMRKQVAQHEERLNQVVNKYEKENRNLKDQLVRERKLAQENLKRTVEELQRSHKLSIDQLDSKNREQMRQLGHQQSEEIRQLNKRHEERLDQVIVEVKKT